MASKFTRIRVSFVLNDEGNESDLIPPKDLRIVHAAALPKREIITLTASVFNALTVPTGAKGVWIDPKTATTLTVKGVTGDTGIVSVPTTANSLPIFLPLGTSPSIGILNNVASEQVVEVTWV